MPTKSAPYILAATILGSALAFIDGTVVNVALPALQRALSADVTDVQWVVEAYALPFSALLLVGGSLGDRFGRRRVYAIGIALFALASLLCGLAGNVHLLIAARALQGVGAALLVPGSLALIAASFAEQERGRAIGTWSGASAMTTALGPALGGWLIDHLSWRWAFFLNLPLAAAALALLFLHVPESRDESASAQPLDLAGAALATLGLAGVVYGLIESSRLGWGAMPVRGALIVGVSALGAFVVVEARARAPMLPLALFRSREFTAANLLTFALYGALAMTLFALPLNLVQVHGYGATGAGASLLPFILVMVSLSRWSGGLIERVGPRLPLTVGPLVAALGFVLFGLPGTSGSFWTTFLPALLVLGLGMAITVAPLTTTVMNAVESTRAGIASGINNAVSRTAGLLAIAVLTIPMLAIFSASLERELHGVSPRVAGAVRAEASKLAGIEAPAGAGPAERAEVTRSVKVSFVRGFRFVAFSSAVLAALSGLCAFLLLPRGKLRETAHSRSANL